MLRLHCYLLLSFFTNGLLAIQHFQSHGHDEIYKFKSSNSPTKQFTPSLELISSRQDDIAQDFNPFAPNNIAVYIGHTPNNFNASLPQLCNDTSINIVLISFVRGYNGLNQLPTFDFAPTCDSFKVTNFSAPFYCNVLAQQISTCQSQGKKIFVSVGGSVSNTTFSSPSSAENAANTLWNVFGAGTATPSIRPFGNVTVDGFDIDQESGPTTYFDIFASTLTGLYATSGSTFYLSAAPLCANTTAVLPPQFYAYADFVFVRFYDARACDVGTSGFIPSIASWNNYLNSIAGSSSTFPRILVGGLSFNNSNNGYIPPENFSTSVQSAYLNISSRFGGVMLWDGTNGEETLGVNNETFIEITKQALANLAQLRAPNGGTSLTYSSSTVTASVSSASSGPSTSSSTALAMTSSSSISTSLIRSIHSKTRKGEGSRTAIRACRAASTS